MLHRKISVIISLLIAGAVYFLALFLFSGNGLVSEYAIAVIAVCLAGAFLIGGMLAGLLATLCAGIVAESLLAFPDGIAIIASACTGLAMLHLSKLQSIPIPWKGTLMIFPGTIIWSGLFEVIHFMQPGNTHLNPGIDLAWSVVTQGIIAASIWLVLLIAIFGIKSLFASQNNPPTLISWADS